MSQGAPTLASTSSRATTPSGWRAASSVTSLPPREWPASTARSTPSSSSTRPSRRPYSSRPLPSSEMPLPATSTATPIWCPSTVRRCRASRGLAAVRSAGSPAPSPPGSPSCDAATPGLSDPPIRAARPPRPRQHSRHPPVTSSMQAPSAAAHFSCPGGPGAAPAPDPGDTGQVPTMTDNDPRAVPVLYRGLAAGYDRSTAWLEPYRHRAVSQLRLRPGDVVVDVGCGTGLSFEPIQAAIGPGGRLIGIEPSPEMLAIARARVEEAGWDNVTLLEAGAEEAVILGPADAALFAFTHDVAQSPE